MIKILCFGDSVTFGESDNEGGWADRIKRDLTRRFVNAPTQEVVLYNLGIGGETTDGLKLRFQTELLARAIKGQNTQVILAYGANDIVIHKAKNIVPEQYFENNLRHCVEQAKSIGASVLLLSLLPIGEWIEGQINRHQKLRFGDDILRYNRCLRNLAEASESEYLDLHAIFTKNDPHKLISSDGVHPNSLGHQQICRAVSQKLNIAQLTAETAQHIDNLNNPNNPNNPNSPNN